MVFDLPPVPPSDLNAVISMSVASAGEEHKIPSVRYKALIDAGFTYGAQSGLARRSFEIAKLIERVEPILNRTMRFEVLMLDNNVVPPVLETSKNSISVDGDRALRLADASYRIEKNAYFTTTPLSWHQYLLTGLNFEAPKPHKSLLPRDKEEKQEWANAVKEGWKMGFEQANQNFLSSVNRMVADIDGMVIYRELLAQKMVTKPHVAQARLGVTGDANEININDRVLRITAVSELKKDSSTWTPRVTPTTVSNF